LPPDQRAALNLIQDRSVQLADGKAVVNVCQVHEEVLVQLMKKLLIQLVIVLFSSTFAFLAGAQEPPQTAAKGPELRGSDCILIRTVRDYTPLDDSNLLIWGPAKRGYLVTLVRPAFGIRSSFQLGFSSRDDRLCPYGGDSIVFGNLDSDSVRVRSISRVNKEQAEEILIRFGKKEPAEKQATVPPVIKGADVEELD
jgi:Family of unknown function (DUF6491)